VDQAVAALLGAGVGFAGIALTQVAQELRARGQDRRAQSKTLAKTHGMTRMVGAELRLAFVRVKNAPLPLVPADDEFDISTRSWDRYGPDICADLPMDVVVPVFDAYAAIDIFLHGVTGKRERSGTTEESVARLSQLAEGVELLQKNLEHRQLRRDALLRALDRGYNALMPYVGDTRSADPDA
jgi:hypothetical protein